MGRYVAGRLLVAVPTLLGLSILIFALVSMAPGDPAEELTRQRFGSVEPTEADVAETRAELGLDRPAVVQYLSWLGGRSPVTWAWGSTGASRSPPTSGGRSR